MDLCLGNDQIVMKKLNHTSNIIESYSGQSQINLYNIESCSVPCVDTCGSLPCKLNICLAYSQ